jgi:cytochrome P450
LLGDLPAFYKDKLAFLDRCAEASQPVIRLAIGGPTLLLREPADIRYVLQEAASSFAKSPLISSEAGRRMFGQGVLTSSGDRHRYLRAALQPVFSRTAAVKFAPAVVETVKQITASWPRQSVQDLRVVMPEIAETVASRILFGAEYLERSVELNHAFRIRREYLQYRFSFPFSWSQWLPVPLQVRYRSAMRTIRDYVQTRIAEARRQPGSSSLLNLLAATSLTDAELLDEGIALGITGYEPVGEGLVWALWLIARHPEVQARVRAEAVDSAPLRYTWAVLQESMRLYPPTWLFVRYATAPVTLPSGEAVPIRTKIYLSPWVIHRDPRFYEQPLSFRPERFLGDGGGQRPALSYFPFGAGSRMCLGRHLTEVEGTLILASLIRHFEISAVTSGPVRLRPRMTLQAATPLRVQMEARS